MNNDDRDKAIVRIEDKIDDILQFPCKVHKTQIKLLNVIVFGFITLIITGFIKSQFFPSKAAADTEISEQHKHHKPHLRDRRTERRKYQE